MHQLWICYLCFVMLLIFNKLFCFVSLCVSFRDKRFFVSVPLKYWSRYWVYSFLRWLSRGSKIKVLAFFLFNSHCKIYVHLIIQKGHKVTHLDPEHNILCWCLYAKKEKGCFAELGIVKNFVVGYNEGRQEEMTNFILV